MSKNFSFFFGAGAELSYNMPNGGKFALDIFRQNKNIDYGKSILRAMIKNVKNNTDYSKWLPTNYQNSSITIFGKTSLQNIIKDILTYNRDSVIDTMNNFNSIAKNVIRQILSEIDKNQSKDSILKNIKTYQKEIRGLLKIYKNSINISLNKRLNDEGNFFNSFYIKILLTIYLNFFSNNDISSTLKLNFKTILSGLFELYVGALGEKTLKELNNSLFENRQQNSQIDFLDNFTDIFSINYEATGLSALQFLIDTKSKELDDSNSDINNIIFRFAYLCLEKVFCSLLNYRTLIDSHWNFLYSPSSDWGKFTKITTFLYTVYNYITQNVQDNNDYGYYNDIALHFSKYGNVTSLATSNYTNISDIKLKSTCKDINKTNIPVIHINGYTETWYDPYLNKLVPPPNINSRAKNEYTITQTNSNEDHITVPLLFTQSGTKPLTAITKSKEYVELYDNWMKSDYLIVIGFSFSSDDEHINCLMREFLTSDRSENNNSHKLICVDIMPKTQNTKEEYCESIANKLHINYDKVKDYIDVIFVNPEQFNIRKKKQDDIIPDWLQQLRNKTQQ